MQEDNNIFDCLRHKKFGIRYAIMPNDIGFLCAYVGLPTEHPLYGKTLKEILEDNTAQKALEEVNGGVSFAGRRPFGSNEWWIGWDYGHAHDLRIGFPLSYAEIERECIEAIEKLHWIYDLGLDR